GVTGKFFFQFGVAMSAAVLISLLEAVIITPMRAAAFMKTSPKISKFEHKLDHWFEKLGDLYRSVLKRALNFSGLIVFLSLVVFVLSLFLVVQVRREFIPPQDQNLLLLSAQMPPGTSLEVTNEAALQVEKVLTDIPEIQS